MQVSASVRQDRKKKENKPKLFSALSDNPTNSDVDASPNMANDRKVGRSHDKLTF